MRIQQIALAAALLGAGPATFALTPAQIDGSTVRLWLSGTPALTSSVFKALVTMCAGAHFRDPWGQDHTNPGEFDAHLYEQSSTAGDLPSSLGGLMAFTCTVNTDDGRAGSLDGKKLEAHFSAEGSSFDAVAPHIVINGEAIPYVQLKRIANVQGLAASGQCAAGSPELVSVNLGGSYPNPNRVGIYRGCAISTQTFTPGQAQRSSVTAAPERPEGGFASIEYNIIKANLSLATDLDRIGVEYPMEVSQVFGLAVSYPLYYQLQKNDTAAGKIAATCVGAPFSSAAPNVSGACQPDMAASTYTAISNRDNIGFVDGTLFGAAAVPPGLSGMIRYLRRYEGTGTQSALNLRFLNSPCATGPAAGALNPVSKDQSARYVKVAEQHSVALFRDFLTLASNDGEFALGWMSMTNVPIAGSDRWAFVKLDGMSPNFTATGAPDGKQRQNAIDGNYTAWYNPVAFIAHTAFPEGLELMYAIKYSLISYVIGGEAGLYVDPASGSTAYVGKTSRGYGSSCQPAF